MINNHGDRKSPNWGCGTPSKWPKWLINGGDPNYLLTGMILQVQSYDLGMGFFDHQSYEFSGGVGGFLGQHEGLVVGIP